MSSTGTPFQYRAGQAGVTEDYVRDVIDDFYRRVRSDPVIGPIFDDAIDDWDAHIERILSFWLTATRLGSGYQPRGFMPAHLNLPVLQPEHLSVWLGLFRATLAEHGQPEAGEVLYDIAVRMGESILVGRSRQDGDAGPGASG